MELDSLIQWIRCPMKLFWKQKQSRSVFDYESLLRSMLLNTLKAGYREAGSSGSLHLDRHSADIWEYLLRLYRFPEPKQLFRNMTEFCSLRNGCLEDITRKYGDSTDLLNKAHWWDLGLVFSSHYYDLRNEINEFQGLLGFPEWQTVRTYYRECEYYPVSLADVFCDYMSGISLFSFRRLPEKNIRFDVPAYLELEDIRLAVRFDILWQREKVYKSVSKDLKPGLIAEQLVPLSAFGNADRILRERRLMRDIRLPLTGTDYEGESGKKIRIDAVSCCTLPQSSGMHAWKESECRYDNETRSAVLSRLNRCGMIYLKAVNGKLYIPAGLVKNALCASCSYLKDCFSGNIGYEDPFPDSLESEDPGDFREFLDVFADKASLCDNRIMAIDLISETISFLKEHLSRRTFSELANAAENLKRDFISERKGG